MTEWRKAKKSEKPPRGRWAPGNYLHICHTCCGPYVGDKRATECADCAYKKEEK